jgi:hypothetical protein
MKSLFESYAEMQEQLKGNQHKIDKNKNNKIDAQDFKLLQKEETPCKVCGKVKCECDDMKEATEPPFDKPYTTVKKNVTDKSGAVHSPMSRARDLARKALQNTKQKKYGTIQGHERFTSIPDNLKQSHFGKTNEEVLDEANHRDFASAGMMHPTMAKNMSVGDTMDYYEPKTGDKVHGKVMHKSDTEVHMKQTHDSYDDKKVGSVHKFKIGSTLPEEVDLEEVLKVSDGAGKWISDFVHSENPKFAGKSKKERQQMALGAYYAAKKGVKEGVELVYELKKATLASYVKKAGSNIEYNAGEKREAELADWDDDSERKTAEKNIENRHKGIKTAVKKLAKEEVESIDEISKATLGSYAKKASFDSAISKKIAADFDNRAKTSRKQDMKDANTNIANDYKTKSWKRQDNVNKAIDRLTKEEVEQEIEESRGHKIVANFLKKRGAWDTPKKGDDLADKSYLKDKPGIKSDLKNLGRFLTGKKETNEETMKTFKEFAIMLEMEFKDGRYVHKGKYGTSYDDPEGKEDNDSTQAKEPAVKRGRGRPAGAKSGARQLGGASKKGSGVEYTGYKLHLPNSNKSY